MNSPVVSAPRSRRAFLKQATAAGTVAAAVGTLKTPVYGQNTAPSANVTGANNRLSVGYIGVGGQGFGTHVRQMKDSANDLNINQAAVCDLWAERRERAQKFIGLGSDAVYSDHRRLLERKDIDVVVIATVDHWHAPIAIDAVNAGKHVLIEKPMTRYLDEAFAVYDAVKRSGKKMQIGAVFCFEQKWHEAAALVRSGKLGHLVLGQSSYCRNSPTGEWNYPIDPKCTPDSLDWKRWLGQTGDRPFSADHFFRWRKYHPYCAGILGDLLAHRIHPMMIATGTPEFPKRVACLGTQAITSDRDVPDNTQIIAEFPGGYSLLVVGSTVNERGLPDILRTHKAVIEFGGDRIEVKPERPFAEEMDPIVRQGLRPQGVDFVAEYRDLFTAIRENGETRGGIELCVRAQVLISLAEASQRLGAICHFDEKARKVTDASGKEIAIPSYEHPMLKA